MTTPGEGMFVGRALFSESDDALLLVIDRGVIESANAAATRLFGYDVGGLDGMELACLIPESARSDHAGKVRERFDVPEIRPHGVLELSAARQDGSEFPADIFLFPFTRDGQQVVLVGVFELADQVEIDRTTEGIRSIRERVGNEGESLTLEDCRSLVRQACDLSLHALSRSAESERYDKDFWLGFMASQQVSEGSRFAHLFESMPLPMWESDCSAIEPWFAARRREGVHDLGAYFDAHPESVNHAIATIRVGRRNRAAVDAALYVGGRGVSDPQALPPTLRSILRERLIGFFEGRSVVESEIHEEDPDLGVQNLLVTAWARQGEGGHLDLSSVFSTLVDIQPFNQLERERQIALEHFEMVFNNASAGITLLDPETGVFVRANRAFTTMLGYPEGGLDGVLLSKITPASSLKDLEKYIRPEEFDNWGVAVFERPYLQRDGGICWGRVSTRLPDRTGGEPVLAVAVIIDTTDVRSEQVARSKAEDVLRRKSSEFETFAWRSAHDLSEPLRKIRVFGER
ncbi:MAG: PAS domain S-box protein, partial [Actinomycetota bacterium]|nr:PAS domain S-box protein [Actinomycetota bacterium]